MSAKEVYHHRRDLEQAFAFCQAVKAGGFVFISGALSWDAGGEVQAPGDWEGQLRNVYVELRETLAHFGLDFSDVVKETVYCTDMEAMTAAAHVRAELLGAAQPFAATWVEIKRLVNPGLLLEVEMTACCR